MLASRLPAACLSEASPVVCDIFKDRFQAIASNFQRGRTLNVDLHWDLSPDYYRFGPVGKEVWPRAIEVQVGERKVPTLAHEDHLLYLAVHGSRHGWPGLSPVCNIAYLASHIEFDRDLVLARTQVTRCLTMLNMGLPLARDLMHLALPREVLTQARHDRRSSLWATRMAHDFANRTNESLPLEAELRAVGLIDRLRDRVRYLSVRIFAPTLVDWSYRPLAPRWYRTYYLIRLWRLILSLSRNRRTFTAHVPQPQSFDHSTLSSSL